MPGDKELMEEMQKQFQQDILNAEKREQEYNILDGLRRAREAAAKEQKPKRKRKNQYTRYKQLELKVDSMQTVNRVERHGLGLWNSPRIVAGVRVDKKLYFAFKEAAIALYGSTCNPIEAFMAGVVGIYKTQKMNAVNRVPTINIGEIKIERNLRERRKITKTVEVETETTETLKCCFSDCDKDATAKGFYNDNEMPLCELHFRKLADSGSTAWRFY